MQHCMAAGHLLTQDQTSFRVRTGHLCCQHIAVEPAITGLVGRNTGNNIHLLSLAVLLLLPSLP